MDGSKELPAPGLPFFVQKAARPADDLQRRHLKSLGQKTGCSCPQNFYATLPNLQPVDAGKEANADVAWHIYHLHHDSAEDRYKLALDRIVYTMFEPALEQITKAEAGPVEAFISKLQEKLDEKLDGNPPDAPTLADILDR